MTSPSLTIDTPAGTVRATAGLTRPTPSSSN
jgi:hypothetical protein